MLTCFKKASLEMLKDRIPQVFSIIIVYYVIGSKAIHAKNVACLMLQTLLRINYYTKSYNKV